MNRRGMWQLILMAREGDRQAIEELFFSSFRSAYLILYTITSDRKKTLDILCESYVEIFENLEELENGSSFDEALCRNILERANESSDTKQTLQFKAKLTSSADSFHPEESVIHDFDTLPSLDVAEYADDILSVFASLSVEQQLCTYLFYYIDSDPERIASILGIDEKTVRGVLYDSRRAVLPKIEKILKKSPAFQYIQPESTVLWALRNTKKYSLTEDELAAYHFDVTHKLLETDIIDTTMKDGDEVKPIADSEMQNFKPMKQTSTLRTIFNLRTLIIFLFILVIVGGVIGIKQLREYNRRKNDRDSMTNRTTLSMSTTAYQPEHIIYFTERTPQNSETETEEELSTEEETTEIETEVTAELTTGVPTTTNSLKDFTFVENVGSITITKYNGSRSTVEIPDKINGKNVTEIGESAFYNSHISSIKLPRTLTTIRKSAFQNCTSLQTISLPAGVTHIGDAAFYECTSLRAINLSDSLSTIGSKAFYKCTSLSTINFPSKVRTLGDWAFAHCTSLSDVAIPASVTSVGNNLFYECISLEKASIESSTKLVKLGNSMFYNCTSLNTFVIPSTVKTVSKHCFFGCRSLTTITIPSAVTIIDAGAFQECSSLDTVKFGTGLQRINASAFSGCSSLKEVRLPSSAVSIGDAAFKGCTDLRLASIPASVTTIGKDAFADCSKDLYFSCPSGSAAEQYAKNNDIHL